MVRTLTKEEVIERIAKVLEEDGTFTDSGLDQRAREIMKELLEHDYVEFSPSRYGTVRTEQDRTTISILQKGHNFYVDKVIEEIDVSSLRMGE